MYNLKVMVILLPFKCWCIGASGEIVITLSGELRHSWHRYTACSKCQCVTKKLCSLSCKLSFAQNHCPQINRGYLLAGAKKHREHEHIGTLGLWVCDGRGKGVWLVAHALWEGMKRDWVVGDGLALGGSVVILMPAWRMEMGKSGWGLLLSHKRKSGWGLLIYKGQEEMDTIH